MRNSHTFATTVRYIACLAVLSLPISTIAAPVWYSLGLDDRAVNCILASDTGTIIAGTDSGVSVRFNSRWYNINMLPVTALERVSSSAVAAAAGNGSWSDGVYIGRSIINGPPFYSFTLGKFMTGTIALTSEPIITISGPNTGAPGPTAALYACNSDTIMSWTVVFDSLTMFKPIGLPDYAFGVEMPYCSSLRLFSGRLFAGGYDRSPMAGSSYLMQSSATTSGDTMFALRRMKTTAIVDGRFSSILGSSALVMAIADADSGVFFYDKAKGDPWYRIPGPTSNPIRSLHVLAGSVNDNTLYAANKDGVYGTGFRGTTYASAANWSEIGNMPVEPLYITGFGYSADIVVGTVKGIYRYGENGTGVLNTRNTAPEKSVHGRKKLTLTVTGSPDARRTGIDLQGRSVVHQVGGVLINNEVIPAVR